ncbi:MAG: NADH-quinone oxidoreductase subunit J family protein [Fimbriimonadales bacterium]
MSGNLIVFAILAVIASASAVGVIAFKNPVRSALSLVINFFTIGIIYFTLNLDLLGISQILVYTGLIMILFLFCILLLNLGAPEMLSEKSWLKTWVAIALTAVMVAAIVSQVVGPLASAGGPSSPDDYGKAASVGKALFTGWVYAFEIASVLLLVGIVGSILVAKRRD